ncbi:hypothetical protein AALP_AA8G443100 [Arabis alpina]|uniref:Matrin-type domain-containing protein n=1 Tax=Arabis alpina TaxID=50452 RepID=A0A087GDD8_ARAAL|nr:hypothetical protein AALP_AA8G443100 [Arabis alpina]
MSRGPAKLSKENEEKKKKVLCKNQTALYSQLKSQNHAAMVKEQAEKLLVDSRRTQQESDPKKPREALEQAFFLDSRKICEESSQAKETTEEHTLVKTDDLGFQGAQEDKEERDVEITNKVVESGVEASTHTKIAIRVKKKTETLVDVKNIEESGQDNDLQSRDVQESMKFSEKQNKEVTETWTRSEWRNGRKSWKVKERLENESGATLNVELSRDFRVTKEVRECFGAVLEKLEPSKNEIVVQKLEQGLEIKLGEPENAFVGLIQHIKGDMNKKNKRKKKKKSTVIEYRPEAYVCSYCSVTSDCPTVFESHLKGQKHAAMIKKHTEPGEVPEEELIEPERSVEDLIDFYEEVLENDNQPLPNAEYIFTELNPEFSDPEEAREWFDAIFKKLELSQDANVTRELESIPKQNLEMNSGDPESNSTLGSDKNKKKNKVTKDEAYECTICNVICDCPIVFESHLLGRKHAASVKKHSEVIFDDKKILEESMKEVCGIAKERVENESEKHTVTVKKHVTVVKKQAGTKFVYVRKNVS